MITKEMLINDIKKMNQQPTHSMTVCGNGAEKYILNEEYCTTPCTPGGCWDRLRTIDAKILLIGVNHIKNTYIHSVEDEKGAINYAIPQRL